MDRKNPVLGRHSVLYEEPNNLSQKIIFHFDPRCYIKNSILSNICVINSNITDFVKSSTNSHSEEKIFRKSDMFPSSGENKYLLISAFINISSQSLGQNPETLGSVPNTRR